MNRIATATISVFCLTLLAGCSLIFPPRSPPPKSVDFLDRYEVVVDECGLLDIQKDFFASGEYDRSLGARYAFDDFNNDLYRQHRLKNWWELNYVVRHGSFQFVPGCRSEFRPLEYGRARRFQADERAQLCRITPFSHRSPSGSGPQRLYKGLVQSCIDVNSYARTFDIHRHGQ